MAEIDNSAIPTESFFIANTRIMATICGGQLTTDHNMGLSAFYAPEKDSASLIQSTRVSLVVDGQLFEPYDSEERSCVVRRGYIEGSMAVRILWQAGDIEVEDTYFIPPGLDVAIQRVRVRNCGKASLDVKLLGVLYPQLGATASNKKGVCKEAIYEGESSCVLVEDQCGGTLLFGFQEPADEHQVGEVCSRTDVYYDLEDLALSGNGKVEGVTPNAALARLWPRLAPGETREIFVCLGQANSKNAALALLRDFRAQHANALDACLRHWQEEMKRACIPCLSAKFGPRIDKLVRRAALTLRSTLKDDGSPMGGVMSHYQNVGQTRNGSYILLALDSLGFHSEVCGGYRHYVNFKLGDARYHSADENDQLGTIIHVFKRHCDLTGELSLAEERRKELFSFADRLVSLGDTATGLVYSERAIHEFVAISRGYETYVNTMSWRGLADASTLAAKLGDDNASRRYADAADSLQESILKRLVDPEHGIFVKRLHHGKPDITPAISMLTPALFGVADPHSPVVDRTIFYVMEKLSDPKLGGLYRYPLRLQPWPEHPYGGPWVTYTCWLARIFLLRGEHARAADIINWLLRNVSSDSDLIPEHFSSQHIGQRGFGRVYIDPYVPEIWATAEFMRLALDYARIATSADSHSAVK